MQFSYQLSYFLSSTRNNFCVRKQKKTTTTTTMATKIKTITVTTTKINRMNQYYKITIVFISMLAKDLIHTSVYEIIIFQKILLSKKNYKL